jgi:hypothetical protein
MAYQSQRKETPMNENESIGFEEFESALFGGDNQIDVDDNDIEETETDDTEDG